MGALVSLVLQMLQLLFQPQLESLRSWHFRALAARKGSNFHDTELCFWSIIIFMQVIAFSSELCCTCVSMLLPVVRWRPRSDFCELFDF